MQRCKGESFRRCFGGLLKSATTLFRMDLSAQPSMDTYCRDGSLLVADNST